jgi:hypothetical protein
LQQRRIRNKKFLKLKTRIKAAIDQPGEQNTSPNQPILLALSLALAL